MRLERLTYNKIKIFLTTDDLSDRGLSKEDIWKDSMKWNQLFHDMLEEASDLFGLEILGSVAVEVFSLQAQGMVMIVTVDEHEQDEASFDDEGFIEMQVTMEGREIILFEFANIEDVIQLSKRLWDAGIGGGSLYFLNDTYYLSMSGLQPEADKTVALLAEYGNPSIFSIHRLMEYGREIIDENTVDTMVYYFF